MEAGLLFSKWLAGFSALRNPGSSPQKEGRPAPQGNTGGDQHSGWLQYPPDSDVEPQSSVSQNMTGFGHRPLERKVYEKGAIRVVPNPVWLVRRRRKRRRRFGHRRKRQWHEDTTEDGHCKQGGKASGTVVATVTLTGRLGFNAWGLCFLLF